MGTIAFFPFALLLGMVIRRYVGTWTTVTILPHQGGVLFNRGKPTKQLDAGRCRVRRGSQKVIIVDKRPAPFSFEDRAVSLSDGATAVYGFSGSVEIDALTKVLYCARNYPDFPAYVLLCSARSVLNDRSSGEILTAQETIAEEIASRAKPKLSDAGFKVQSFRFTNLSLAAPAVAPPADIWKN